MGISYSVINTACSALSSCIMIVGCPVGKHQTVCRYLKDVFNKRPALPKNVIR